MAVAATLPPKVIGPKQKHRTPAAQPLPDFLLETVKHVKRVPFDPKKHLRYTDPEQIYSMTDIGREGQGISPNALTTPFTLFTDEAIDQMRAELFTPEIVKNYHVSSDFAADMLKGYGPANAPFIFAAWNSPELLAIMSKLAGIEVVPVVQYDIGHANISVSTGNAKMNGESNGVISENEDEAAFSWHFDSTPFVCVTMLSDCTGMAGGETAVRIGSEVMKVRGPTRGNSVFMQGRYIEHQALKARGGTERITMVNSFRPKSAFVKDETVLVGYRPLSHLSPLYKDFTEYRLENIEERIRDQLRKIRERETARLDFDTASVKAFLREQREYIDITLEELVEY